MRTLLSECVDVVCWVLGGGANGQKGVVCCILGAGIIVRGAWFVGSCLEGLIVRGGVVCWVLFRGLGLNKKEELRIYKDIYNYRDMTNINTN